MVGGSPATAGAVESFAANNQSASCDVEPSTDAGEEVANGSEARDVGAAVATKAEKQSPEPADGAVVTAGAVTILGDDDLVLGVSAVEPPNSQSDCCAAAGDGVGSASKKLGSLLDEANKSSAVEVLLEERDEDLEAERLDVLPRSNKSSEITNSLFFEGAEVAVAAGGADIGAATAAELVAGSTGLPNKLAALAAAGLTVGGGVENRLGAGATSGVDGVEEGAAAVGPLAAAASVATCVSECEPGSDEGAAAVEATAVSAASIADLESVEAATVGRDAGLVSEGSILEL